MAPFLVILGILFISFAGIAVRVIFIKDGTMRGTCASQTPQLNKEGIACGLCGRMPNEGCGEDDLKKA